MVSRASQNAQRDTLPPTSNTGAERTSPGPAALVDWLAYTLPDGVPLSDVLPPGEVIDWVTLPHGGYGYPEGHVGEGIKVYRGGRPGQGVHVVLSGDACRALEARMVDAGAAGGGWNHLLAWVRDNARKVTRLDIAIDDRAGLLHIDEIVDATARREWVGRLEKAAIVSDVSKSHAVDGTTVYLGSPSSRVRVRIYDKRAEQLAAGEADTGHWVRVELQLRDERAASMLDLLVADRGSLCNVGGVVRGYVDYVMPVGNDSNKRRWPTCTWWVRFTDAVSKVRLCVRPRSLTLAAVKRWVYGQVAPSLAVLKAAGGWNSAVLDAIADDGSKRWKPKHVALIAQYWQPPPINPLPF